MILVSSPKLNVASGMPAARIVSPCDVRVWGMTVTERLRRALARAGIKDIEVADATPPATAAASVLVCRGDYVLDEALVKALVGRRCTALADGAGGLLALHVEAERSAEALKVVTDGGRVPDGLEVLGAAELAGTVNQALRKREPPLVVSAAAAAPREIEWRTYSAAYKGITDVVTKWVWPRPAFHVTRWCAALGISPNTVTAVSALCVLAAWFLFQAGWFALGLLFAWGMTFLDTVDGKLARVTLRSSPIGNVFDHGVDLLHPPFWYWAWWRGLPADIASTPLIEASLWIVIAGYVLGRLEEGIFLGAFKFEIHSWRPFDSLFRQITARRNPNLVLLTASVLFGRPDLGLVWVAAWSVASLAVHALRIVQAAFARAAGRAPVSWLERSDERLPWWARFAA